jgi:hypothetical protein
VAVMASRLRAFPAKPWQTAQMREPQAEGAA